MAREQRNQHSGLPALRGEVLPERVARPGEPLPPLPESCYPPGAVPLEPAPEVPHVHPIGRVRTIPWEPWEGQPFPDEPEPHERITARELRTSAVLAALVFGVFVFSPLGWLGGLILAAFTVAVYLVA